MAGSSLSQTIFMGGCRTGKTLSLMGQMGKWSRSLFPPMNTSGLPYPEWFADVCYGETVGPKLPFHSFDWRKRTVTIRGFRYTQETLELPRPNDARDLVQAVLAGKTDQVRGLLHVGVDPNQRVEGGMTAAFSLAFTEDRGEIRKMAELLKRYGADFNVQMDRGQTPLLFACDRGNDEAAEVILMAGGQVNHRCAGGETPLGFAIRNCSIRTVVNLIGRGADVNAQSDQGVSCLQQAVHSHDAAVVRLLLECGANPNVFNAMGLTPFHIAALSLSTHLDVLEVLSTQADVNAQVAIGHPNQPMAGTALHLCAKASIPLVVVQHLVKLGCDPFSLDPQGKTALEVCPEETRSNGVYGYLLSLHTARDLKAALEKPCQATKRSRL